MKKTGIISLPKHLDRRGNLSVAEELKDVPFEIARVYWVYGVPGGERRHGHAYRRGEELIIALSGSFDVVTDDGMERKTFRLSRSYYGLYVAPGTWRELTDFSTNSLALVISSTPYDPDDYLETEEEFKAYVAERHGGDKEASGRGYCKCEAPAGETDPASMPGVYDCAVIELPRHLFDRQGDLCVAENDGTLPFETRRVYYTYDIPAGESRGGHAHRDCMELVVAASGSFTVTVDDGKVRRTVMLNRPYQGILLPTGIWRTLDDFSSGAVCLVLASHGYDPTEYIEDYQEFLRYRGAGSHGEIS